MAITKNNNSNGNNLNVYNKNWMNDFGRLVYYDILLICFYVKILGALRIIIFLWKSSSSCRFLKKLQYYELNFIIILKVEYQVTYLKGGREEMIIEYWLSTLRHVEDRVSKNCMLRM